MSDSPLITYSKITKNHDHPRNHKIDTITIHCYVGQVTAEQGCDYFASTKREASANYVVGYDGSIGLSVHEGDRSWCSASPSNDNRAVTIEVACERSYPYEVTDDAYKALIKLVADICRRNGIKKLQWRNKPSLIGDIAHQNMTVHRWFANTACPGKFLMDRMGKIAVAVNEELGVSKPKPKPAGPIKVGDYVRINGGAKWYNGGAIPSWVMKKSWRVDELTGTRAVLDKNGINSPIDVRYLRKSSGSSSRPSEPSGSKIKVDGVWGKSTTRALQRKLDTEVDGIVSRQYAGNLDECILSNAIASGWEWQKSISKVGSSVIKALQKKAGATADGVLGPGSIRDIQSMVGTKADGIMGKDTVRAIQRWINR